MVGTQGIWGRGPGDITYRSGLSAAQLATGATQQSSELIHVAWEIF